MPCDQNTLSDIIFLPCASLCFVMWVLDVENVESLRFFQVLRLLVIVCASGELKAAFEAAHRGFDDAIGWFTCAAFTIALQMYGLYVSKFCFVAFKVKHVFFIFLKQYLHSTKTVSFFFSLFLPCSWGGVFARSLKWLERVQDNWGYVGSSVCSTSVLGVRDLKTLAQQLPIISNPQLKKSIVGQLSLRATACGGSKGRWSLQGCMCVCVFVCAHCFWKGIRALRPEAWTIRTILLHFHSLPLSLFHTHT